MQREIREQDEERDAEIAKLKEMKDKLTEQEYDQKVREASQQGIQRENNTLRFTLEFVQDLISDTQHMDIDIFSERSPKSKEVEAASSDMINKSDSKPVAKEPKFNVESLRTDLDTYTEFKSKLMELLGQIEAEIFGRQTH